MSGTTRATKPTVILKLQTMSKATRTYFANKILVIHGKAVKAEDLATSFDTQVAAMQGADALHTQWAKAVSQNHETYTTQIVPSIAGLKAYAEAMFGPSSTEFAAFGFTVKTVKKALVTKVAAVAQALATRAARHTMGAKQRAKVKGVVTKPETADHAAPSTTPAPGASNGSTGTPGASHS